MRKAIGFGLVLAGMASGAWGQNRWAGTVSVATLRVPAEAREHFERARKAALSGREDEYEREIAKALEMDRNFAEAYVLRGSQEVLHRDFAGALTDSYLAERLDRGVRLSRIVRVSALNGLRRFGEAWTVLEGMDGVEGESWDAKYERARAAVGMGDAVAAMRWSGEALVGAPAESFDGARVLRGDALEMAGRYAEAAMMWRQYLDSPRKQKYREQVLVALARAERMSHKQEMAVR